MGMSLGMYVGRGWGQKGQHTKNWRWYEKREHRRLYRRMLKVMLEDCPPNNRYHGWAD